MTHRRAVAHPFRSWLVVASALCALVAPAAAQAQATPEIVQIPSTVSPPPPPAGMRVTCMIGPDTKEASSTCPVIRYQGLYTWAFSFLDNHSGFGIVTYDGQARLIKETTRDGARYVYKMTVDPAAKTVSIWGQSNAKIDVAWADLPGPQGDPVYSWLTGTAQPANAVLAPNMALKAVCRGTDQNGYLWAGWWDGAACNGSYSGHKMPATNNVQFLTLISGAAQWRLGGPYNFVGALPPNAINAGPTYSKYQQILCSYGGYIGWVYQNTCTQSGTIEGGITPFVLVGTLQ